MKYDGDQRLSIFGLKGSTKVNNIVISTERLDDKSRTKAIVSNLLFPYKQYNIMLQRSITIVLTKHLGFERQSILSKKTHDHTSSNIDLIAHKFYHGILVIANICCPVKSHVNIVFVIVFWRIKIFGVKISARKNNRFDVESNMGRSIIMSI